MENTLSEGDNQGEMDEEITEIAMSSFPDSCPNGSQKCKFQENVLSFLNVLFQKKSVVVSIDNSKGELSFHLKEHCSKEGEGGWQKERQPIEQVRDYIKSNLHIPPSLKELTEVAGMSHPKLNRCFRQQYGVTASEYIRNERLLKAKEILQEGSANVTEAAHLVGYRSVSHFTRAYKTQFGQLPSRSSQTDE